MTLDTIRLGDIGEEGEPRRYTQPVEDPMEEPLTVPPEWIEEPAPLVPVREPARVP